MIGYNTFGVRYAYYQGRLYSVVKDGPVRLVFTFTGISRVHAERGRVR